MQNFNLCRSGPAQAVADLEDAAGVGGDDDARARLEDVFDFSTLQSRGHFRFSQIIAARTAATDIGLWHFNEAAARDGTNEFARWPGDVLRVSEMAGVMVSNQTLNFEL